MNEKATYIVKGMNRDTSPTKASSEYAYDIRNFRLTATEKGTQLSLVNEKSSKAVTLSIDGFVIGSCVINQYIVLFTHTDEPADYIYRIDTSGATPSMAILYDGSAYPDLGFDSSYPIDAIGIQETDNIIKVYWVDGLNQPRVINIANVSGSAPSYTENEFDFLLDIAAVPSISVAKTNSGTGYFPAGVVQYYATYSKINGQETPVVWVSDIQYLTEEKRALKADEYFTGEFTLTIQNTNSSDLDTKFDYLNIYSSTRSSYLGERSFKLVGRLDIPSSAGTAMTLIDTNSSGETIEGTALLYKGGDEVVAKTLAVKDNTLFLGNFEVKDLEKTENARTFINSASTTKTVNAGTPVSVVTEGAQYYPNLPSTNWYLRKDNYYRIGLQFLDDKGKWTDALFAVDKLATENPSMNSADNTRSIPQYVLRIENSTLQTFISTNHFIAARPLIVCPTESKRTVVAQGIISPTVFTPYERKTNGVFSYPSWVFRPYNTKYGFLHVDTNVPKFMSFTGEFGASVGYAGSTTSRYIPEFRASHSQHYADNTLSTDDVSFYVDDSVLSFYSPEFDTIDSTLLDSAKFRIKGYFFIDSSSGTYKITTASASRDSSGGLIYNNNVFKPFGGTDSKFNNVLFTKTLWKDNLIDDTSTLKYYPVYLFNYSGSLNDTIPSDGTPTAELKTKIFANERVSQNFTYLNTPWLAEDSTITGRTGITNVCLNDGVTPSVLELPTNVPYKFNQSRLLYSGNIDSAVTESIDSIWAASYQDGPLSSVRDDFTEYSVLTRVKTSSSKHAVFAFNGEQKTINGVTYGFLTNTPIPTTGSSHTPVNGRGTENPYWINNTTPTDSAYVYVKRSSSGWAEVPSTTYYVLVAGNNTQTGTLYEYNSSTSSWEPCTNTISSTKLYVTVSSIDTPPNWTVTQGDHYFSQAIVEGELVIDVNDVFPYISTNRYIDTASGDDNKHELMWIAEFYRPIASATEVFGDSSNTFALNNLQWRVAGPTKSLSNSGTSFSLDITTGDTMLGRWDCLKTTPVSTEDENQIVEVMSFLCESYVNLNARSDVNRGLIDNTSVTLENFNLTNPAYNNINDYFTYRTNIGESTQTSKYPNTVLYSLSKVLGEDTDSWTQIVLSSTLDLDGDRGEITAIRRWNNALIAFQKRGFSEIKYNENIQIATNGMPIEVTNSGKVTGKNYLSTCVGCSSKESMCVSPNGIYFMDENTGDFYRFNGQLDNLSSAKGFHTWTRDNTDARVFYDLETRDVLISPTSEDSLAFNELVNEFTSFYSYRNVGMVHTINNISYALERNTVAPTLYQLREGNDYGKLLGLSSAANTPTSSIEYIVNPKPLNDKIFDLVEFRTEGELGGVGEPEETFETMRVYNSYQDTEDVSISNTRARKFRIWRVPIGRAIYQDEEGEWVQSRDRIRDIWAKVKLIKSNINHYRFTLHDTTIGYTI